MPNWCTCELEIEGDRESIERLLNAALPTDDIDTGTSFSLEKFIPMPVNTPDVRAWREENWGTKWDINATLDDQGEIVFFKFDSAWSPPIPVIEKISKDYPSLSFLLTFEEPNMDFFGIGKFQNGLQKELNTNYSERFYFNMNFNFLKTHIENGNIVVPVVISRLNDPYDFDAKNIDTECILQLPLEINPSEVQNEFEESVILSSDENIIEDLSLKKHEIITNIIENFDKIKSAAEHNELDKKLLVKNFVKSNKRKI